MKIYFEDGSLRDYHQLPIKPLFILDASDGTTYREFLDSILVNHPDAIVYTNSIAAFNNKYAWNDQLELPEIYVRAGEYLIFTRIDKVTDKKLNKTDNLAKMYMDGEFE